MNLSVEDLDLSFITYQGGPYYNSFSYEIESKYKHKKTYQGRWVFAWEKCNLTMEQNCEYKYKY